MTSNAFTQTTDATRTCPHCGARIADAALCCPRCARELPKKGELAPRAARWFGLGLVALGALLTYWFDCLPWQKIGAGEPTTLSLKGAAFGPLLLGLGLAFFLPERPGIGETETLGRKLLRWALLTLMLAGFVAGVVIYFWLRSYARAHGYDV